jgi:hypothetical protein
LTAGRRAAWSVVGGLLAAALLAGLAEGFLRLFPPRDLLPYLGESSPLTGPYAPDYNFGIGYRSWDAFCTDYAERLDQLGPLDHDARPTWAMFGNSFVQAPGMLADTARARMTDHHIVKLGRNEPLVIRLAQIKLLLEQGLRPERVVILLLPLDAAPLGEQPLSTIQVTAHGALTYRPRLPGGPGAWAVAHSRLALTGWVRSGRHKGDPGFRAAQLNRGVAGPLLADLRGLFDNLARVTRAHGVPVTVILLPNHEQVMHGALCGFQDALGPVLRGQGYNVLDPRDIFAGQPDRAALFLPDKHLTPLGNALLLDALLEHLRAAEVHAVAAPGDDS